MSISQDKKPWLAVNQFLRNSAENKKRSKPTDRQINLKMMKNKKNKMNKILWKNSHRAINQSGG